MPARFCSQCGHEISSTARFCSNCAAPLDSAPQLAPGAAPPSDGFAAPLGPKARGARRVLITAVAVTIFLLVTAVIILAYQVNQQSLLNAQGPRVTGPSLLNAPVKPVAPGPALLNAPTPPEITMPADVAAYLAFLQKIEARRVALRDDVSGAMALMPIAKQMQSDQSDPEKQEESVPDNVKKLNQGYSDYTEKWQGLIRDFRAVSPPEPCTPLSGQYLTFLVGYAGTIGSLQVALLNGDVGAAMKLQGAQKEIDANAVKADDQLRQICALYNAPKPFTIQPDTATPSLLGQ